MTRLNNYKRTGDYSYIYNIYPGPIAAVLALLIAILALEIDISWGTFAIVLALAIVSMIASRVLVKLVKKLHEYSKRASIGTTIGLGIIAGSSEAESSGLIVLIFVLALAVIPFLLAFLLELTNKKGAVEALKSAASATGAYMADSLLKLIVFVYAIKVIFDF